MMVQFTLTDLSIILMLIHVAIHMKINNLYIHYHLPFLIAKLHFCNPQAHFKAVLLSSLKTTGLYYV